MQVFREIREIETEEFVVHVPKAFRKKKVEVIILPLYSHPPKKRVKNSKSEFPREIENFLKLGGSGAWEGNLDEMRETRDGIG